MCTSFETLCLASQNKSLRIAMSVFRNFLSALHLFLIAIKGHLLLTQSMEKSCDLLLSAEKRVHAYVVQCAKF